MKQKLELYFHIPFCERKCLYCDFLSAPATEQTKEQYMEALLTELVGSAKQYKEMVVETVFFGGGTPSTVDAKYIKEICLAIREHFFVSEDAEITIEINPGTVNRDKLKEYRSAGINRLSIGLQSALDEELKRLGRIHTWAEFLETYNTARELGFDNINVDLMSALPGQSAEDYERSLQKVLALTPSPEHISAYSLILEEGTPFYRMHKAGEISFPTEEEDRAMYHLTKEVLAEAGYQRYEISNYALPGKECRHNSGYWRRVNYVGYGIGAASLVQGQRFQNTEELGSYISNPLGEKQVIEQLTEEDCMEEFMFLGLRMITGISTGEFEQIFEIPVEEVFGEVIEKNIRDGLLERFWVEGEERIRLTETGLNVSNYVMAQFLLD
ncbi:MAG: oxygen-independent coproporphyrinogen III oxidase [Lachnospiraceae bacterium]|nr:oxygen-independent coproporphyrinogen III oxidase [Lachnospiraceae bacterium]